MSASKGAQRPDAPSTAAVDGEGAGGGDAGGDFLGNGVRVAGGEGGAGDGDDDGGGGSGDVEEEVDGATTVVWSTGGSRGC